MLNVGGVGKNCNSQPISDWSQAENSLTAKCDTHNCTGPWQVDDTSQAPHLFFTGDDDEMFTTRSLSVRPKTRQQHLIVRSRKSEAEVALIKDCARGITRLKLTTDGCEALRCLSTRAEVLVI